ncbi:MAG: 1-deoxy-D-xylulose-5-phosphate synthase, partial [Planctomycetota bacterium]|nr:1-deoxy-D-xylulose-5-phosphate synthase [Planctomycetota bacterium]
MIERLGHDQVGPAGREGGDRGRVLRRRRDDDAAPIAASRIASRTSSPLPFLESHAVAFAGGTAKAGARPVVDIYSTFLQRSFDQIFQEVALQDLPVIFTIDRAGLVGADGPTHHGTYDIAYMRIFPNMVVMAPGDEKDIAPMLEFALGHTSPVSMRYPRA